MASGGPASYVRRELRKIFRANPEMSLDSACEKLYAEISFEMLAHILLYTRAKGKFPKLSETFVAGDENNAGTLLKIIALDIFRLFALEDPELATKITVAA